jgi:hypothetical protein
MLLVKPNDHRQNIRLSEGVLVREAEILQAGSPDNEKLQADKRSRSADLSLSEVQRVALDAQAA